MTSWTLMKEIVPSKEGGSHVEINPVTQKRKQSNWSKKFVIILQVVNIFHVRKMLTVFKFLLPVLIMVLGSI